MPLNSFINITKNFSTLGWKGFILVHELVIILWNQKSSQDCSDPIFCAFLEHPLFSYARLNNKLQFVNSVKAIRCSPA